MVVFNRKKIKRAQNANMVVVNFFILQISEYSSSKIMSYYIVLACATTASLQLYGIIRHLDICVISASTANIFLTFLLPKGPTLLGGYTV
jgi:hypothetical protein